MHPAWPLERAGAESKEAPRVKRRRDIPDRLQGKAPKVAIICRISGHRTCPPVPVDRIKLRVFARVPIRFMRTTEGTPGHVLKEREICPQMAATPAGPPGRNFRSGG
jgi:hypothetical protein